MNGDTEKVRRRSSAGRRARPSSITVERNGRTEQKTAQLQVLKGTNGDPLTNPETGRPLTGLGFTFDAVQGPTVRSGPLEGVTDGWDFAWFIMKTNVQVIGDAFTSSEARGQINSVVGVGAVFNQVADDGLTTVLRFVGVISLALGIFNLIPILPLDGGHIVFAIAERVKGSAFSAATYGQASFIGLALVMLVFVIALQNDIGHITGDGLPGRPLGIGWGL